MAKAESIGPVDGYQRLLRFVRRRLGASDEAADVVQDAYVRLAQASRRQDIADEQAFLKTTAVNLLRDRGRRATVRGPAIYTDERALAIPADQPLPDAVLAARQQMAVLERALAELPSKRRTALVWYRFDNIPQAVIAERLGISVSMVEKHVRLGLEHCQRRLAEANGDA